MKASVIKYGLFAALGLAAAYLAVQIFTVLDRPYRDGYPVRYVRQPLLRRIPGL